MPETPPPSSEGSISWVSSALCLQDPPDSPGPEATSLLAWAKSDLDTFMTTLLARMLPTHAPTLGDGQQKKKVSTELIDSLVAEAAAYVETIRQERA